MKIKALTAIILAFGMASISAVPASAAPNHLTSGSAVVTMSTLDEPLGFGRVSVNATVGVDEGRFSGRGQVEIQLPAGGTVHGTVNCLAVNNNRAGVSGTLNEPVNGNSYFRLVVTDNDVPGANDPDQADLILTPELFSCLRFSAETPVQSGDFVVMDRR